MARTATDGRRYYSISQAAAVIGVSRVSMWRWINAGQIPVARLGHRTARILAEDLDRLIQQRRGEIPSGGHVAQFYEHDDVLLDAVSNYLVGAFNAGEAGLSIATAPHAVGIELRITAAGFDPAVLEVDGRFLALDANATLGLFMIDGRPDQQRFYDVIGGAIDRMARSGRTVRAFGEMVAVLAAGGCYEAALELERLWEELGKTRSFSLFCGYPLGHFTGQELSGALGDVATAHDQVVPTESYMRLTANARLREILSLQQKARSLELEIARRRNAEEKLREALLAEQSARASAEAALRQRDEFVSVASHELKTPLTTLSGYAQLILRRFERDREVDPERVRHSLQSIATQADKLRRLLGHLLDLSRLVEGKLSLERQPTDVVALVEGTVALACGWGHRHRIALEAPPRLCAEIDGLRVEQVLTNLLDNAVKYSPDGGLVEVVVSGRRNAVELSVRDHGLGIPHQQRAHIFERFYQAHTSAHRSGLGLGLYISRQIIELHGGTIRAEFPRDGGTRFVVRLPLAAPTRRRQRADLQIAAD